MFKNLSVNYQLVYLIFICLLVALSLFGGLTLYQALQSRQQFPMSSTTGASPQQQTINQAIDLLENQTLKN